MHVNSLPAPLLWIALLAPIVSGITSWIIGRVRSEVMIILNVLSWIVSLVAILFSVSLCWPNACYDPLYIDLRPYLGVFSLILDGLSLSFALAIVVVSLAILVYSKPYMDHRFRELGYKDSWNTYMLLYQLFTAGMLGSVLSTNTVEYYLFLEVTLIPSFLLIALYGYGDRIKVALMYLVWTHIGAGLYLLGSLTLAPARGLDTFIPTIGYVMAKQGLDVALVGGTLMTIGLAVKMAMLGLHYWLPHAHAEAPTPVSALLSPLLIGVAAYGLVRFVYILAADFAEKASLILVAWSLLTIIYAGLVALRQDDVKRFLAYSSISQMGYLMLGFALLNKWGFAALAIHYVAHAIGKAVLFAMAGVLIVSMGTRYFKDLGGLMAVKPVLAALALIGFMHLTGIPPALALWSEYLLARGLMYYATSTSLSAFTVLVIAFMVAIVVSTVYSFVGFKKIFLGPLKRKVENHHLNDRLLIYPIIFLAMYGVFSFLVIEFYARPLIMYLGFVGLVR